MNIKISYSDLKIIKRLVNDEYLKLCEIYYKELGQGVALYINNIEKEKNNLKNLQKTINNLSLCVDINIIGGDENV